MLLENESELRECKANVFFQRSSLKSVFHVTQVFFSFLSEKAFKISSNNG